MNHDDALDDKIMAAGFDHPCKQACSGWQQGFERGKISANESLGRALSLASGALQAIEVSPKDFNQNGLKSVIREINEILSEWSGK